jgi:hypothetical protein
MRFVRFPEGFEIPKELQRKNLPRLVASPFPYFVRSLARSFPEEWQCRRIEIGGHVIYIALDNRWEIHKKPERSPSVHSEAFYVAKAEGIPGFLLGYLDSQSHTSDHWHEIGGEYYFLIAGQAEICCVSGSQKLTVPGQSQGRVETAHGPEGFHPVITTDQPLLVVILMEQGLDRSDHYYL